MNIKELEENHYFSCAHEIHTKKINEIIKILNSHVTHLKTIPGMLGMNEERADQFEKRLKSLEDRAILKPDYHPDDVKFNKEIPLKDILHAIIDDVSYLYKEMGIGVAPDSPNFNLDLPEPNENLKKAFKEYHDSKEKAPIKSDYTPEEIKFRNRCDIIIKHHEDEVIQYYKHQMIQYEKLIELFRDEVPKNGTFEWAIVQMKNGKVMRRKSWDDQTYMFCSSVSCHFRIRTADILGYDWEIINEKNT